MNKTFLMLTWIIFIASCTRGWRDEKFSMRMKPLIIFIDFSILLDMEISDLEKKLLWQCYDGKSINSSLPFSVRFHIAFEKIRKLIEIILKKIEIESRGTRCENMTNQYAWDCIPFSDSRHTNLCSLLNKVFTTNIADNVSKHDAQRETLFVDITSDLEAQESVEPNVNAHLCNS